MSEKIYAWLLRLYPWRFREAYGEEALQLFRDRARDEKGFKPKLRFWLDLLGDLVLSVPRVYFHVHPELMSYSAYMRRDGGPSFIVFRKSRLVRARWLLGARCHWLRCLHFRCCSITV